MLKRHKCRFVESMSSHVESMSSRVESMSNRIKSTMGQQQVDNECILPYSRKITKEKKLGGISHQASPHFCREWIDGCQIMWYHSKALIFFVAFKNGISE